MHYLIIAVLAFALSTLGCEGKTGPAGPTGSGGAAGPAGPAGPQGSTGPQGPAGADGADGAPGADGATGPQGEKGETGAPGADGKDGAPGADGKDGAPGADGKDGATGPQGPKGDTGATGPQGPKGEAGDPGSVGAGSTVHHIALAFDKDDPKPADYKSAGIEDDAVTKVLRVKEELMISAVARTQNGSVVPDVTFDWNIEKGDDPIEQDTSDDTMSNTVEAIEAGTATLRVTAEDHDISADIKITVTAAAKVITLKSGTPPTAIDVENLSVIAPEELVGGGIIMASVDVGTRAGKNFSWSSDSPLIVEARAVTKVKDGVEKNPFNAMGKIMAKARGTAMVTVAYDGAELMFKVEVEGRPRELKAIIDGEKLFTVKAAEDADSDGASFPFSPSSIPVEITLRDADGNAESGKIVNVALTTSTVVTNGTQTHAISLAALANDMTGGTAATPAPSFTIANGETTGYGTTNDDGSFVFQINRPDALGAIATSAALTAIIERTLDHTIKVSTLGAETLVIEIETKVTK